MTSLITIATLTVVVSAGIAAPLFDGRIIGGLLAPEHSFPFLVGLSITKGPRDNGTFWCGGSLIAPNFVLTAAHCVNGTINIKVKLGTNDRTDLPLVEVYSNGITIHDEYDSNGTENDIALIELPTHVTLTDDIQLIQLASPYMDQDFLQSQHVIAAGWGKMGDNRTGISKELRYVDLTVIDQSSCAAFYDAGLVTPKNICIDGSELKGTCSGDSGGPLIYQAVDDTHYLVGLTSFGSDHGCEQGYPTVFTRITSFYDWITEHTQGLM